MNTQLTNSPTDTHHPVRVLHVFRHLDVGGAEMRMRDMARRIDWERFQLHFCIFSGRLGDLADEIDSLGGTFHHLPLGFQFASRFKALLRQQQIDVAHAHMHYSSGLVVRLAAQVGTPRRLAHFQSCSDGQGNGPRRRLQRWIMRRWIDRYATDIVACGENAMRRSWGDVWSADKRCRVVLDGIDPAPFFNATHDASVLREFGLSPGDPLFIHVGNIREPKNHPKLISVFHEVVKRLPRAKLLLVGRAPAGEKAVLDRQIAALNLVDRVFFTGLRTDVPRLMKAASALIFPSIWEGLPGAVLEACAAGLPVLASDLPEINEIATRLPLVHCLPLAAGDDRWAAAACGIHRRRGSIAEEATARRDFLASPFHVEACVDSFCDVWQGANTAAANRFRAEAA